MLTQPTEITANTPYSPDLTFHVNEMFFSIQGEGTRAGLPCIFVRLQGCTLRCAWCDTKYALDHRQGGELMTAAQIIEQIRRWPCNFVEFTGGDPLEQENIYPLMRHLCDAGFEVAIETGGHIDAQYVDERVIRIIDLKCPDSKMQSLNCAANLENIRSVDEFKFVLASRADYEFARSIVLEHSLHKHCAAVLFSPVFGVLNAQELSQWILEDALPVRLQLQMHKFIWHPETRGV